MEVFLTHHKAVILIFSLTPMTDVSVCENELLCAPQEFMSSCRVVKKILYQVMKQRTARFHQVLVLRTVEVKQAVQVLSC